MILFIFLVITLLYTLLIGAFVFGFDKIKPFLLKDLTAKTKFSIVIPFRNEEENLPNLLKSLSALNYPINLYEFIFVNDYSEDESVHLIHAFFKNKAITNYRVLENDKKSNSPKKNAIQLAINFSKHEWILTTDADCIVPEFWMDSYNEFIQENDSKLIAGPVTYYNVKSFMKRFQLLDFMSLIGASIGAFGIKKPILCNGANLAYNKQFFKSLNGFSGNINIASGDDVFLLEKAIKKAPKKIFYLKSKHAIVLTQPETGLKAFISQRKRWASKASNYSNSFTKITGLIVLIMNAVFIAALPLLALGLIHPNIIYLFIIKLSIDFLLIFKSSRFFNQEHYLTTYIFSSILYPFFSVYIAVISSFTTYKWKGRDFSK